MDKYGMMNTTEHGLKVINIPLGYVYKDGSIATESQTGRYCMAPNLNEYQSDAVRGILNGLTEDMTYLAWQERNGTDPMASYNLEWLGNIHKVMEQVANIQAVKELYPPVTVFRNPPNCIRRYKVDEDTYNYTLAGYGMEYLTSMLERWEEMSPLIIGLTHNGNLSVLDRYKQYLNQEVINAQFDYLPELPWHIPPI